MIYIRNKSTNRIIFLDILRIVSIFSVVMLHVSAQFVSNMETYGHKWWWSGNIFDSATRWCVPVLIMISGYLILGSKRDEKIHIFLKKRLNRVLIPLLAWSLVYFAWNNRLNININMQFFIELILRIYENTVNTHLWYLYMVVGLYLITPIIKPFVQKSNESNILYFIYAWFIANGIIEFLGRFYEMSIGFYLQFFHWSIGYYILGIVLGRKDVSGRKRALLYVLGLFGLGITIYGTYILMINNNGVFRDDFYNYLAPNVIFMAIGVFILFKHIKWDKIVFQGGLLDMMIQSINKAGFGIYLIHPLIIDLLRSNYIGLKIGPLMFNYIIGIPLVSIIVFLISYVIIAVIETIPLLRRIV